MKVAAVVLQFLSLFSFVTAYCLSIPNTLEIVSHLNSALANRIWFETASLRSSAVVVMFEHFNGSLSVSSRCYLKLDVVRGITGPVMYEQNQNVSIVC